MIKASKETVPIIVARGYSPYKEEMYEFIRETDEAKEERKRIVKEMEKEWGVFGEKDLFNEK